MGIAQRLITPGTSDGSGNLTVTLPVPTQGFVFTGVLQVPSAPAGASWTLQVNGNTVGMFVGANQFGPIQVTGTEITKLVGSGLTAGTLYAVIWTVSEDAQSSVSATPPTPYGISSVNVQGISGGVPITTADVLTNNAELLENNAGLSFTSVFQTRTVTGTAKNPHNAIVVEIGKLGVPLVAYTIAVRVNIGNRAFGWQTLRMNLNDQLDGFEWTYPPFIFIAPSLGGEAIGLDFVALAGGPITLPFQVFAADPVSPPRLLRADGRLMPQGSLAAEYSAGGSGNLIAAPAAGLGILLKSLYVTLAGGAGTNVIEVKGTIGGTTIHLALAATTTTSSMSTGNVIPPDGLLLDPATAIPITVTNASIGSYVAAASYDLVA